MNLRRKTCCVLPACLAALLVCRSAPAQDPFPSAPVRLIVPAAPGGGFDVFARILGKKLAERWGQQVVIENRAGGGGNIAAANLIRSRADGYSLLLWNDTMLINPALAASVPYDPQRDFSPVSLALFVPNVLVAHPATGLNSLADVIERAKKAPANLSYGSPGPGSPAHLGTELMNQLAGIEMRHIPYKGAGPALADLVAGHIPLAMIAVPGAMEYVRSARLTPLAVTSERRVEALAQVPTMKEAGLANYRIDTFFAILGPAGMKSEIVARLEDHIRGAIMDAAIHKQLVAQGFQPVGGSAAELAALISRDTPVWRELVRKSGAKSE